MLATRILLTKRILLATMDETKSPVDVNYDYDSECFRQQVLSTTCLPLLPVYPLLQPHRVVPKGLML